MMYTGENSLLRAKVARDDVVTYQRSLAARQRTINAHVLDFAADYLPSGALLLDGCAGPEGSKVVAAERGYGWVGADISFASTKALKSSETDNVVLSDATALPFAAKQFDAVLFTYALNNISNHERAVANAARVSSSNGTVMVTDPGPSMSMTNAVIASLVTERPYPMLDVQRTIETLRTFAQQPYTVHEYVDTLLASDIGISRVTAHAALHDACDEVKPRDIRYAMQLTLVEQHFRHLDEVARQEGLERVHTGVCITGLQPDGSWQVSDVLPLQGNDWIGEFMTVRERPMDVFANLPESLTHAKTRISAPVVIYAIEEG